MNHPKPFARIASVACAMLLTAGQMFLPLAAAGQQAPTVPSPAVRVTVRMVLVDAVVTDKDGKAVTGLGPQDFTVLEDGKAQKLTTVSFENAGKLTEELRSRRMQLPPNVTTSRPEFRAPAGAPVIMLLDALNTPMLDQARARMEMLKYLNTQLEPGRPLAVYTLGSSLRLLQDFTDDPALLKAAVASFTPNAPVEQQISRMDQNLPRLSSTGQANARLIAERMREFFEDPANLGIDMRVGVTLTAFRAIAQAVAGLPGRKSMVWVTGSFPEATYTRIIKYSADGDNNPNRVAIDQNYDDRIKETTSALTDAQIAVYAVDARGLLGQLTGGAESQGLDAGGELKTGDEYAQDLKQASSRLQDYQATMKQVAEDTGGKVFVNQNDMERSVSLSVGDGAAYYLLGYTPSSKADGKFHKIEVKVDRPGVTVRSRRGYYAVQAGSEAAKKQRDAAVAIAMQLSSPGASGVTFDARVVPPAPASKMKVGVDFIVDPTTIGTEDAGGGSKTLALEFHVAAYGTDGKLADHRDTSIKATLKPADYARVQQGGVPYHLDLELGPGQYMLRLGVMDQNSGIIGTADMPLDLQGK
jgi:VWFA-related protein